MPRLKYVLPVFLFGVSLFLGHPSYGFPTSPSAWTNSQWEARCAKVRTTFNPDSPLSNTRLSLNTQDPRFVDFLYWVWANKITEHQVEQVGGTEWDGPTNGVIFHWAPGSRWEMHTVVPFKHAIHHIAEEHNWVDTMFSDFFDQYKKSTGVSIAQRLSADKAPTWAMFLKHIGGPESPYYRYVFHQESFIDTKNKKVIMVGGQGVEFHYSYDRYMHEVKEVLTDCKAFQFFQLYDHYGQGFASKLGWAGQPLPFTDKQQSQTGLTNSNK
ncbi:hypothetical protein [Candidatus Nitronereus thalassa]|uniref:Uncharacterized protein n=1 Tax=Candidatus Nitronereus thalassa TaxID=3020898 RepID=A0ABU3K4B9_9BACT|nr:hypothetical protein [Candidatus Nitronereus thalassa]MDT7041247.1 hypothetical protein [Candidatus Nitronereus thalassa]